MYVKSIKSIHYIYIIDILFIYTYRYNFFPSASPPSAPALPSLPWPQRRVKRSRPGSGCGDAMDVGYHEG